jgi:hypothetical protein
MAVRPHERRRSSPRSTPWSSASPTAAGIALLVVLHTIGVDMRVVAGLTAAVALAWMVMLFRLQHLYVRSFRDSLTRHAEVPITSAGLKLPEARRTLLAALRSDDETQVVTALGLVAEARHQEVGRAAAALLDHPANAVRAAAVRALDAIAATGHDAKITAFLAEPDANLRRAAIGWLLSRGQDPAGTVRRLLDGDDPELRALALETLVARRRLVPGVVTLAWIDARIERGSEDELAAAALGLALVAGPEADERLQLLLEQSALEVRRSSPPRAARARALEKLLVLLRAPGLTTRRARPWPRSVRPRSPRWPC